jgi:hypothetical protein
MPNMIHSICVESCSMYYCNHIYTFFAVQTLSICLHFSPFLRLSNSMIGGYLFPLALSRKRSSKRLLGWAAFPLLEYEMEPTIFAHTNCSSPVGFEQFLLTRSLAHPSLGWMVHNPLKLKPALRQR